MSTSSWRARLAAIAGAAAVFDEPLASKVAFRIGGPADAYVKVSSAAMLSEILRLAEAEALPITVLGGGTNVLVADEGLRGIVLRLSGELAGADFEVAERGPSRAVIGAGALNAAVVAQALDLGLTGIEFLATIPGTFGGALIMNAGAHGGEIAPFVARVELLDAGRQVAWRAAAECGFAYRHSGFGPKELLTRAEIVLPRGDVAAARQHLAEMRAARKRTQPIGEPNAGSIFKNPPGDYAGRLIEAAGLKGRRVGGARVSELHANFIVNDGTARASEVVELGRQVAAEVSARFGVALEWEVKRLGDFGRLER